LVQLPLFTHGLAAHGAVMSGAHTPSVTVELATIGDATDLQAQEPYCELNVTLIAPDWPIQMVAHAL
jgi:hypothetical protein